jgi:hypothetical protein
MSWIPTGIAVAYIIFVVTRRFWKGGQSKEDRNETDDLRHKM